MRILTRVGTVLGLLVAVVFIAIAIGGLIGALCWIVWKVLS